MMFRYIVFAAVVCLVTIVQPGISHRILCVFPMPSISHHVAYRALTLELNKRGHELVVVTPDPLNDPTLRNYTEIDVRFEYDLLSSIPFIETRRKMKMIDWLQRFDHRFHELSDRILGHPNLRKLYEPSSNEKFDLVIVEALVWQSMYPLAKRFDVPMIGIASLSLMANTLYNIGSPVMPTHPSHWELEMNVTEQQSFWERVKNFIAMWKYVYWFRTTYILEQQAIAKKHFGNDIPDLNDLEKNISLFFVNQLGPISYARPNVPKIIQFGGSHVSKQTANMPKDLKKFLDEATDGFLYMSFGSNVKSTMLPKKTIDEFITAFSRLPYRVLWKFENDVLPGKPDNVYIMKWVPQQAVLAHPNLKVFIYQGGVQSTEEAVHYAVPLIGFPVITDEDMQISKMVSLGVAKKLEITAVDGNELFETINTIAGDPSYKQRMLNLRSLIDDAPHDPLENAIWWTEHVIRYRGAPHLHSTTADEPWYRRQQDMDIVAFLYAGSVVAFGLTSAILYQLIKTIHYSFTERSLHNKKKN